MVDGWRCRAALGVLGLTLGCRDSAMLSDEAELLGPPTELAPLCGSTEPVRLLRVDGSAHLGPDVRELQWFGDRLVVGFETPSSGSTAGEPSGTTIYSVDLCGEDVRVIGEDVDVLLPLERAAPEEPPTGPLLGCSSGTGDVLALDVEGGAPPRVVLPAVGCVVRSHGEGLIGIQRASEQSVGSLVLLPDVSDPVEPRVVLEGVVVPETAPKRPDRPSVRFASSSDEALVLTPAGALLAVELSSGERTVLREGVRAFIASADRRFVLWEEGLPEVEAPEEGPEEAPEEEPEEEPEDEEPAPLRLLDRTLGEDVLDDVGRLGSDAVGIDGEMVRIVRSDGSTRLVMLPTLEELELGAEWRVYERHASGVVLMRPSGGGGRIGLDPQTLRLWRIIDGEIVGVQDVGNDQLILNQRHGADDFSYWRASVHGGEPELLAEHVLGPAWLAGGRWSTVRIDSARQRGALLIVDGATGEVTVLDPGGVHWKTLGPRAPRGYPWPFDDDVIVWSVHDGERSGLWAARVR